MIALQCLKDSAVFTVYRQDLDAFSGSQLHNDFAGDHQGFLICQGQLFAGLQGSQCGEQSGGSHHRGNHQIGFGAGGYLLVA